MLLVPYGVPFLFVFKSYKASNVDLSWIVFEIDVSPLMTGGLSLSMDRFESFNEEEGWLGKDSVKVLAECSSGR